MDLLINLRINSKPNNSPSTWTNSRIRTIPCARWMALGTTGAILGLGLAAQFTGCRSGPAPATPKPDMSLNARPFYNAEEHPQSPKPPNLQFRGVLIAAAPQNAVSLRSPMVLLRGSYQVQGSDYPTNSRLRLTALDTATQARFTGYAGQQDPSPDLPPPAFEPPDPETVKRMIFTGYFNTDLMATLGLPWTSATYKVRAEFGNIPSNEIVVEIVIQQ